MYIILSIILLLIILVFISRKHQRKVDDFNANMYSKKQHEYFRGQEKQKSVWSELFDFENRVN